MTLTRDEVRLAHLRDDYERLRTRALRSAQRNANLLNDALTALVDDRPHITTEFLERVIERLDTDARYLRDAR